MSSGKHIAARLCVYIRQATALPGHPGRSKASISELSPSHNTGSEVSNRNFPSRNQPDDNAAARNRRNCNPPSRSPATHSPGYRMRPPVVDNSTGRRAVCYTPCHCTASICKATHSDMVSGSRLRIARRSMAGRRSSRLEISQRWELPSLVVEGGDVVV